METCCPQSRPPLAYKFHIYIVIYFYLLLEYLSTNENTTPKFFGYFALRSS